MILIEILLKSRLVLEDATKKDIKELVTKLKKAFGDDVSLSSYKF